MRADSNGNSDTSGSQQEAQKEGNAASGGMPLNITRKKELNRRAQARHREKQKARPCWILPCPAEGETGCWLRLGGGSPRT